MAAKPTVKAAGASPVRTGRRRTSSKVTGGFELTFDHEKSTPGTERYKERGDEPKVGTLYLKKATAASLDNPESVVVTIKAV